jgi:hypothetical protein
MRREASQGSIQIRNPYIDFRLMSGVLVSALGADSTNDAEARRRADLGATITRSPERRRPRLVRGGDEGPRGQRVRYQLTPSLAPLWAVLPIGAKPKPGKISRKGGRRPSRVTRSALAGDLCLASHWSAGRMARFAARAPGADRCGPQPVRRAAGTARAPTPPWPGGPKSGRRRPGAQRSPGRPAR